MISFEKKIRLKGWSRVPYKDVREKINLFIYDEIREEGEGTKESEQDGGSGDVPTEGNPTTP